MNLNNNHKNIIPHMSCHQKTCQLYCPEPFFLSSEVNFFKKIFSFFIIVQVQLSPFPPTTPLCPTHPHLPPSILSPLTLSMCPLYMFLDDPSPISLSPLLSGYCQFILYFNVSVIFCLFILLIRFHLQVNSYGFCLSSGSKNYGTFTQWNTMQQKERSSYPL